MSARPIYLDCNATTPVDEQVLTAMLPYFTERFGNSSSVTHLYGWEGEAAAQKAREIIAAAINATPEEIVFTSGATEANNLAIQGLAEAYFHKGQHIITVATEHNAVLNPCKYLQSLGFEITVLPVQEDGIIDLKQLRQALRNNTVFVSVMAVNNEIGVLQPLAEIGAICRENNIFLHTDAAQGIGKIPLDVQEMKVDLMSLTAHKIYGPKGVGALYVRRRNPRVQLAPQQYGGDQEKGIRSGTLPIPQIVGFGKAVEIAVADQYQENQRLVTLRDQLWLQISQLDKIYLNGHPTLRLGGNLNVSVAGVDGVALLSGLQPVVAVSSGSACSSGKIAPSHVLRALGGSLDLTHVSIRFGIGKYNTEEEINIVAAHFISTVHSLRKQSNFL